MIWLTHLIGLVGKIPATFWGVVVGSFFSLGGVILSNSSSAERLREQFVHDRDIRRRENDLTLRKEIYMGAVEAASAGLLALAKYSNLDIPEPEIIEGYTSRTPAIAKVSVIANERTAKAVVDLAQNLNSAFIRLTSKRVPLFAQKGALAVWQTESVAAAKARDEIQSLMKQFNLAGETDQSRWNAMQRAHDLEVQRVDKASSQVSSLNLALLKGQIGLAKEVFSEIQRLQMEELSALFAIRAELDLPIDEASFTEIVRKSVERQQAETAQFVSDMEHLVALPTPETKPSP